MFILYSKYKNIQSRRMKNPTYNEKKANWLGNALYWNCLLNMLLKER